MIGHPKLFSREKPEGSRNTPSFQRSRGAGRNPRLFLYGQTAAERPCIAIENPVSIRDMHATILAALGIAADTGFEIEQRPFYVTEDGHGQPVREIFA